MIRHTFLRLFALLLPLAPIAVAQPAEIIGFHADIFADWDSTNERLRLAWRITDPEFNGGIATSIAPADGVARIREGDWVSAPGGWESYGVTAGDTLWISPADFFAGALYLGFAANLPSSSGFSGNVAFSLQSLSGPGHLLLSASESVVWTSAPGGPATLNLSRTGHAHFDWLFTQQGLYTLTLGASVLKDGQLVNVTEDFAFHVGAIPEPAAAAALAGLLTLALGITRRPRHD